jgi:NADH-quinone oxidoreductase subunit F
VIGGGNVALDAARTAWRLGAAEVHVIYRRSREDMPAYAEEIKAAYDEGIRFHYLANPVQVLGGEQVTGLVVQRQRLGEFDSGGRRRPVPVEGDVFTLDVDVVIPAIGQTTDTSWMQNTGVQATKASVFAVGEAFNTSRTGVFACGDAVSGPATVIEAVAQGNLVAVAVDHWLQTAQYQKPRYQTPRPDVAQLYDLNDYANARRPHAPELALTERPGTFREVELGFDERTVREEAKRCLRCDLEWLEYMKLPLPAKTAQDSSEDMAFAL